MTFDELWQALITKSAKLENPDTKVEFTSANLKKLLQQVWDQSEKHQKKLTAHLEELRKMAGLNTPKNPLGGMFDL